MKQLTIRPVSEADAAALLKIYSPYVENTAVSFEYSTPSETEFRERIRKISRDYPYLAAEADGQIAGYAYASPFKGREAYRHCAEVSIYLDPRFHRIGFGSTGSWKDISLRRMCLPYMPASQSRMKPTNT